MGVSKYKDAFLHRYASKDEQRAAWAEGHEEECRALAKCAPRRPPPTVRLAARVLWKHIRYARQRQRSKLDNYITRAHAKALVAVQAATLRHRN